MGDPVTYDRPVRAALIVRLDNGDEWEAGPEDYERFGLGRRLDIYDRAEKMLREGLGIEPGSRLPDGPILVRYLIECAICYRHSPWADENGEPWPRDDDDEPPFMEQLRAVFALPPAAVPAGGEAETGG